MLNSIIFKELMPWNFVPGSLKVKNELIRKVNALEPVNNTELTAQVRQLITEYPALIKWLDKQPLKNETPITSHIHSSILPDYSDATSKYYALLISKEKLRLFNAFLNQSKNWTNKIDIIYHTTIALKNIKALAKHTVKEIKERGLEEIPSESSTLTHFVLHYLKQQLIELYFDIQEVNKDTLITTVSKEDFYLTELQLPKASIIELVKSESKSEPVNNSRITQKKFCFGFSGDVKKLKIVITELTNELDLVDRDVTTPEELINVLTSKNIKPFSTKIKLGCETTVFRYILDRLKLHFTNLSFISIENSGIFYSKKNNLIKATNLSVSKVNNPKRKELLDNILQKLG